MTADSTSEVYCFVCPESCNTELHWMSNVMREGNFPLSTFATSCIILYTCIMSPLAFPLTKRQLSVLSVVAIVAWHSRERMTTSSTDSLGGTQRLQGHPRKIIFQFFQSWPV